jgi:Fic family protein
MQEPNVHITSEFLTIIAEIDEFKGQWESLKNLSPDRLRKLRQVATIESIGSSTRIEGSKLTDSQVETLLSSVNITSFKTRDEEEVVGYAETMDTVFLSYEEMDLTENHIRQLHQMLLRHSSKDERHRGNYKTIPNHVVARDQAGTEIGIVFETATPFDTPREMEALVRWANKAVAEKSLHPLLISGVFIVEFLAIHPFQDGNGRLSRILTTLLLLRTGYSYVAYASLESVVEDNKDLYYKALRRTQISLKSEKPDWEPWIGFFLRCLRKQKNNLAVKIEKEKVSVDRDLPALSAKIVGLLREHERLTISDLVEKTGANKNTLKVRLRELVALDRISRQGKARATWYSIAGR